MFVKCLVSKCPNLVFQDGLCIRHSKNPDVQKYFSERKKINSECNKALKDLDNHWSGVRDIIDLYNKHNLLFKKRVLL